MSKYSSLLVNARGKGKSYYCPNLVNEKLFDQLQRLSFSSKPRHDSLKIIFLLSIQETRSLKNLLSLCNMENHELTEEEIDEIQETFYEVNSRYYQP